MTFQRQYQRCEETQPEAEVPAGRALDADAETTEGRGKAAQLGAERWRVPENSVAVSCSFDFIRVIREFRKVVMLNYERFL